MNSANRYLPICRSGAEIDVNMHYHYLRADPANMERVQASASACVVGRRSRRW